MFWCCIDVYYAVPQVVLQCFGRRLQQSLPFYNSGICDDLCVHSICCNVFVHLFSVFPLIANTIEPTLEAFPSLLAINMKTSERQSLALLVSAAECSVQMDDVGMAAAVSICEREHIWQQRLDSSTRGSRSELWLRSNEGVVPFEGLPKNAWDSRELRSPFVFNCGISQWPGKSEQTNFSNISQPLHCPNEVLDFAECAAHVELSAAWRRVG